MFVISFIKIKMQKAKEKDRLNLKNDPTSERAVVFLYNSG